MPETWRPIDTAPTGRVVLLYVRGSGIVEGCREKRACWQRSDTTAPPIQPDDVTHWAPVPRWPEESTK